MGQLEILESKNIPEFLGHLVLLKSDRNFSIASAILISQIEQKATEWNLYNLKMRFKGISTGYFEEELFFWRVDSSDGVVPTGPTHPDAFYAPDKEGAIDYVAIVLKLKQ